MNSTFILLHYNEYCCGIIKLKTKKDMYYLDSSTDFDSNGRPCDYVDSSGYIWIYQGKKNDTDVWDGVPIEG